MDLLKKIDCWLLPKEDSLGYIPYLTLAYLSIFFTNWYFYPVQGLKLFASIAGLIVFLVCYFRAYWSQGRQLIFYICAILLIGVAMSMINWGASVFFVFAAAFCGSFKTHKTSLIGLANVIGFISLYSYITNQSSYFWVPAIMFSLIIGLMVIHQCEVDRNNKALKLSQQQIQTLAKTAERERISRDLHDILGHSLSVITLKSELASKMIDKGMPFDQIKNEIKAIELLSRETLAQVRGAVTGYNDATIDIELLQARVATDAANITLNTDISTPPLPQKVESQLALILREAITNIVRHADTQEAWVSLTHDNNILALSIADQGSMIGYQANAGLNNMSERIRKLGGTMRINTQPTSLQFTLSLDQVNTSNVGES